MIVSTALMIWKGLMVITGSESPIVVVLRLNFKNKFAKLRNKIYFLSNKIKVGAWNQRFIEVIYSY